jgi:hypothetical protein
LTSKLQLVAGLRAQAFDIDYHNNRDDTTFTCDDRLISPRAGLVLTADNDNNITPGAP